MNGPRVVQAAPEPPREPDRHRWAKVTVDLRRDVTEKRFHLWRCVQCGVYRVSRRRAYDETRWQTLYGQPYQADWVRPKPPCLGGQREPFDPDEVPKIPT